MKLFRTICVLGIALCLAASAYAGTQSVKISGDLTIRSFARDDYDLNHNHAEGTNIGVTSTLDPTTDTSDWQTYLMSQAEIQIDADLTDNVSAVLRLFNQRDWDVTSVGNGTSADIWNSTTGVDNIHTQSANEFDVGLDLAYIELKEFLYSPLTLRIGRQDLWFGKGFIVGKNLRDYQTTSITAAEYTVMTSFDAIRATLDYDPWTIDAIYSKIWENAVGSNDDTDLWGINVGYVFDSYNAEAEGYWFYKDDRGAVPARNLKQHNTVNTIGGRASADPIENWTFALEGAYQFGDFVGFRDQLEKRGRSAFAVDASVEMRHFKEQYSWKPVIGAEYIFYSGDDDERATATSSGNYEGWDMMYRGKFDTAYREFIGTYNRTHMGKAGQQASYIVRDPDASYTNQHQVLVYGSLMPTDSLTLDGRVGFFWQAEHRAIPQDIIDPSNGSSSVNDRRKVFMGTEFDVQLTWDYTEDVSFGILGACFFPGGFYYDQSDDVATDLVGTVKLSF